VKRIKLMIRDPMPLDKLQQTAARLGLQVTPERKRWLQQHHEHAGLQLESDRFYCRTCGAVG